MLDREEINRPFGELPNLDIPLLTFRFSPSSLPSAPGKRRGGGHGDADKVREVFLVLVLARGRERAAAVEVGASGWFGMPPPVRKEEDAALGGADRLKACAPAERGRRGARGGEGKDKDRQTTENKTQHTQQLEKQEREKGEG